MGYNKTVYDNNKRHKKEHGKKVSGKMKIQLNLQI